MGQGRAAVRGAPDTVVDLTSVPEAAPGVPRPSSAGRPAAPPAQRRVVRRPDAATGPLSLVPRRRRSPLARAARVVAFPAVVLAVLALGAWGTYRIVLDQQPTTTVIASPAAAAPWGRVVVLHASSGPRTPDGVVVAVTVRVVGTRAGTFDPSSVTLRTAAGLELPVSLGATRAVRVTAGRVVEGRLGFVVPGDDRPTSLRLVTGDGHEQRVALRAGLATGQPGALPPAGWTAAP